MNAACKKTVLSPLAFEIEDDLNRAMKLNDLAEWIGQAKALIDGFQLAAKRHPDLDAALRKHRVAFYGADFGDEQSEGLLFLHSTIRGHLTLIQRTSGLEASKLDPASSEGAAAQADPQ
jgi:hypothetical protein